jgi:DNA-binding LytR/AlgR family response regulator
MNCLIVDDEPLALQILENYIRRVPFLTLIAQTRNPIEAIDIIQHQAIHLAFLDIQMPQLLGLELVKTLHTPPKIIFTTAYRDYAVESYEINAIDYLLKPIAFERFLKAVSKAQYQKSSDTETENTVTEPLTFIFVKSDKKVFKVFLKDILYIESFKDYVVVHTLSHKSITTYQNISYFEKTLPEDQFLRIHRAFIVSLDHIRSFNSTQIDIGDKEFPIGRSYKEAVQKKLMGD